MNHNRAICPECHRVFAKDIQDQTHCCQCSEIIDLYKDNKTNAKCEICNREFYSMDYNKSKRCLFCRTRRGIKHYSIKSTKPKDYTDYNLKKKKPKNNKFVPYEERIRRQEWRRVMDDKGWSHYLKGRKWDKI